MIKIIKKLFHIHNFETTSISYANEYGEIIVLKCRCGKERKALFDSYGRCRDIEEL